MIVIRALRARTGGLSPVTLSRCQPSTSGLGIAEFCEAHTDDFVFIDGIPVLMVQTDNRKGDEKTVKSKYRKRGVPVHSAIRDGFVAWVRNLPRGPLFPKLKSYAGQRRTHASHQVSKWLHDTVGIEKRKGHYWHRHCVSTYLERAWVPDRLHDYLLGHTTKQAAAVYLHRDVKDLLAAIETIPVPGAARGV